MPDRLKSVFIAVLLPLGGIPSASASDPIWRLGTKADTMPPLELINSDLVPRDGHGEAIAFHGYGSRVQINDVPDFTGSGAASISLFFRCDEFPIERSDGSFGASCLLSWNYKVLMRVYSNGLIYAGLENEAGSLIGIFSKEKILLGTWHHMAVTFSPDAQSMKLYLDGTLVGESIGPIGRLGPLSPSTLVLGSDPDGSLFTGEIADIQIFDTALTDAEIQALIAKADEGNPAP